MGMEVISTDLPTEKTFPKGKVLSSRREWYLPIYLVLVQQLANGLQWTCLPDSTMHGVFNIVDSRSCTVWICKLTSVEKMLKKFFLGIFSRNMQNMRDYMMVDAKNYRIQFIQICTFMQISTCKNVLLICQNVQNRMVYAKLQVKYAFQKYCRKC